MVCVCLGRACLWCWISLVGVWLVVVLLDFLVRCVLRLVRCVFFDLSILGWLCLILVGVCWVELVFVWLLRFRVCVVLMLWCGCWL